VAGAISPEKGVGAARMQPGFDVFCDNEGFKNIPAKVMTV
jgi:hypothetical protein